MRIDINSKYCVTSDTYQFIVNVKGISGETGKEVKKPGTETIRPIAYFDNFEGCLKFIVNKQILDSNCKTFSDVRNLLDRVLEEIHEAVLL